MKVLGIDLDKLWWGISSSLMKIIDSLGQVFNFLIGADTIDAAANQGQGDNIGNLFITIFNGTSTSANMTKLYLMIMLGCLAFLCIFVAIGAVKAQFTKGVTDSLQNMGFKSFFAFIKMLAIPLVFFVSLQAMGVIFQFLIGVMEQGTDSASLAQSLCDACWSGESGKIKFNYDYDYVAEYIERNGGEFEYLKCILSSAFLVVTLVTVSITLAKRIIEVFFYYLTAPIAICRTPLDDGKSFDLWKENVVSKLLSAGGIIICMYLFYAIIPIFNGAVEVWEEAGVGDSRKTLASVLKIIFVIGGSCVPASASMLMAQLISQGAGQNESNNMMHTQQMMGNAMRLASSATTNALRGAFASSKGGAAAGSAAGSLLGGAAAGLATAAVNPLAGAARAVGGVAKAATNTAAGAGSAAMSAFSGGGSTATASSSGSGGGATPARPASGTSVNNTPGYFARTGQNVANAWKGGFNKVRNTNPYIGVMGKVGAVLGATAKGVAGTVTAPVKAGFQKAGDGITNSKMGRHHAEKAREKAEGRQLAQQSRLTAKAGQRTEGKYSSLDKAMQQDRENGGTTHTSAYMTQKIGNYEARAQKVENFLGKKKNQGWSTEQKQAYRESQLGAEANRIGAYADAASGRMDGAAQQRYMNFFNKMQEDLGRSSAAGGNGK